jgi:hypothetical protein
MVSTFYISLALLLLKFAAKNARVSASKRKIERLDLIVDLVDQIAGAIPSQVVHSQQASDSLSTQTVWDEYEEIRNSSDAVPEAKADGEVAQVITQGSDYDTARKN